MPWDKLTGTTFHTAIITGCHKLIRHKQALNKINVFPVADGDTGDNLSSTCMAVIYFSSVKADLRGTLESIADASIIGARGNSGIIFSQFFNLLAKHVPPKEELHFNDFSKIMVQVGQEIARVVTNPVPGTMITLIQKWASLCEINQSSSLFAQTMVDLLPLLSLEVEQTKQLLNILQKANVVDAGALGFYYFIEGFTQFLQQSHTADTVNIDLPLSTIEHLPLSCATTEYRYCTEAVLKSLSIDKNKLLHFLKEQGDCASVTGNERITRFHVHTNNPREVFTGLYQHYTIQYPKVDDMLRQHELQFGKKYKIGLVTDSSADLPQDLIDEYQIHQIPLNIHVDEHHLLDKHCFEANYFYKQLNSFKTHPKTSCLNPTLLEEKLAKIASHYDHVLVLSISSKMSGTYDAFLTATQKYANITVLDTKTNSGAHGLLLHYAGQLIASGNDIDTITKLLSKAIKNTYIFVMVNQFESMIRSGRVNKISGRIAQWVNIKPIVSIDSAGQGIMVGKCFSASRARNKLITFLQEKKDEAQLILEDYCIIHAGDKNQALHLAEITTRAFNKPPAYIESVSLAIGLHAGQGCVALAGRLRDSNGH
ncbi:TPA: DegV family EDD domain-containing protein [Legionella pneumophila]|uniref:DegV family EDD domain-containing protein n=1 Tax=Legionella pneumophila TaxID=446 RepID=A0AAN5KPX5_LEGPN|nr:DegV family EDD domain-containing protein [Legionella pneumophila]HAT1970856.1 DegV family EDD domain-containing protein [Legionella pneumophila]HAT6957700.1 DegV family EDD domain-containing protein [Legionella pneumophila]HEN4770243.1 DegV family EDD domain-containing protein [Legionella pneumophila]